MSARDEILKKIDASVKRKKELAKDLTRDKTIATWVSEFFTEVEQAKNLDTYGVMLNLAVGKLETKLRWLDRRVWVEYCDPQDESSSPRIEIHWSAAYIMVQNCEPVISMDASTAFFESAMEKF